MFGAYTDISWTWSTNVSAPKTGERNSFIFSERPNFIINLHHTQDIDKNYIKFKVKEGYEETFHSDEFGPNFYDLKLRGPDDNS